MRINQSHSVPTGYSVVCAANRTSHPPTWRLLVEPDQSCLASACCDSRFPHARYHRESKKIAKSLTADTSSLLARNTVSPPISLLPCQVTMNLARSEDYVVETPFAGLTIFGPRCSRAALPPLHWMASRIGCAVGGDVKMIRGL